MNMDSEDPNEAKASFESTLPSGDEYYSGEAVESTESIVSETATPSVVTQGVTVELVVDSDQESEEDMADSEELQLEKERELAVLKEKFA